MWWLAMICKAESLLDAARSSSAPSRRQHLLPAMLLSQGWPSTGAYKPLEPWL